MATTTNYGWETPDDTDLVKDGASAIRTLGSAIDTTTKNLNPSTTLGDIEYRSSTANTNTRLGIGTTGQVLTVSAGGVPVWGAAGGGGKVLQVINATYATEASTSSSTYTDTGLSATITPSSTNSKILVVFFQNGLYKSADNASTSIGLRLMRGATSIIGTIDDYIAFTNTAVRNSIGSTGATYLDSPATTSAVTYKTQFKSTAATATAYVQQSNATSSITLFEIGA
jgi:hypothetical protein